MKPNWPAVKAKLLEANSPEIVVSLFERHYKNLCSGADQFLREHAIEPVSELTDAETLDKEVRDFGRSQLNSVAVLKLNGGLGTSMGLAGPKSLLPVRGDDTFLALILRQAKQLGTPLVLMNSFSTEKQTVEAIKHDGGDGVDVISFLQHQVPKIDAATFQPAEWPADPTLQWCPPGHGDIYAALVTSGTLGKLLERGRRYLFVSNSDNLGATLDEAILGYFVRSGKSFLMECADRTRADRKGGHLAKKPGGGLLLREKAQCHPDEEGQFQDTSRHRYFNTNNLWIDLAQVNDYLESHENQITLPTIINRKTVDPKVSASLPVYQLETAMGAAIESLPNTDAIRVPRSRFAPVKTTGDLLAVRSDAYEVRPDFSVGLIEQRNGVPPNVQLDDRFFKTIADLDERIAKTPRLADCDSVVVRGNLKLAAGVAVRGTAELIGGEEEVSVPEGLYEGEHRFS